MTGAPAPGAAGVSTVPPPDPGSGDLRDVGRGASAFLLGQVGRRVLQYALLLLLARAMGEAPLGLFVLGATLVQLLGASTGAGIRDALIREIAASAGRDPARAGIAARAGLLLGAAISLPTAAVLVAFRDPIAAGVFGKPEAAVVVAVAGAAVPPVVAMHWGLAVLRALRRVDLQVLVEDLVWPGATLAAAAVLVALGPTPGRAMMALLVAAPLAAAVAGALSLRQLAARGVPRRPAGTLAALPGFLRLASPLVGTGFLSTAGMWLDSLMLGALAPAEELGVYGPVSRTALVLPVVLFAFNALFSPVAAHRLSTQGPGALAPAFRTVARWTFAGTLLGAICLALGGRDLLSLFGPGFVRGTGALMVLAFAGLVNGAVGSVGVLLKMGGRQGWMLLDGLLSQVVAAALAWWLIPRMGLMGAAVAACAGSLVLQGAMVVQVRAFFGIHAFGRGYVSPLLAGAGALGAGMATHALAGEWPPALRLGAVLLACVASFAAVFAALGLSAADRDLLRGLLSRGGGGGARAVRARS
ncbi:oligosaccharide flippase family protein [Myxococcota bacterium]|nr:oligosaccharide flippase family protein [Myxococcota bacterium]